MEEQIYHLPDEFNKGNSPELSLHFYHTNQSTTKNKVCFKQHLLCFLLEGNKEVFTENGKVSFDHHSLLLLQAGNTLMTERTTVNNTYISILLFFSNECLIDFISRHKTITKEKQSDTKQTIFSKDDYILNFEKALMLFKNNRFKNEQLLKIKLDEILFYLLHQYNLPMNAFINNALHSGKDIPFKRAIEQLENFNLTNSELAFLCNMSISTFKRKFSEVFQTTPGQYFIEQKMNRAALLLQSSKRPSDIYFELGYENLSAFSNEFKKHFGVSPKAYLLQS